MRSYLYPLLMLVMVGLSPQASSGEPPSWQMVRDEEGIRLYTAETNTPIKKVKAVSIIDAPLERVVALLDKVTLYTKWVPYLQETRILERGSADELLVYALFNVPWPVTNRDYVYRVKIERQPKHVVYSMQSVPSDLMPEQPRPIRAILIESRYELTALNNHQTRMELIFHTNPRGRLPLWIVNIVHRVIPFDAVMEFRRQIANYRTSER